MRFHVFSSLANDDQQRSALKSATEVLHFNNPSADSQIAAKRRVPIWQFLDAAANSREGQRLPRSDPAVLLRQSGQAQARSRGADW
jgi:hypothetical protein